MDEEVPLSGAPPETSEGERDALLGRVIAGKFVIERRLGAGAMGAVYRAHQTALDRPVAIKVMHGAFAADPTYAARFRLEAKAASRLDHPNLIRVLDYGQEPDGLLYIAMEYLDCRDLFTILVEDWPLSHERMVDILSQTLSGLAEAHEASVLHRDLKPENIMVLRRKGEDGRPVDVVKVCDFGIAKLMESANESQRNGAAQGRKLTTPGLVMGTPEYMSPEQARGESYDVRSDLYAVGVILYQLLTQRLPFTGKTSIEIVWKAMHDEPAKLESRGPTAAPGLDSICVKAMSKRPEDRFQSAREMRQALRAAPVTAAHLVVGEEGRPSFAQAPTLAESAVSATSRPSEWLRQGVIGGVGVAMAIAIALFAAQRTPFSTAGTPASSTPLLVGASAPTTLPAIPALADHTPTPPPTPSAVVEPPLIASASASPARTPHRSLRNPSPPPVASEASEAPTPVSLAVATPPAPPPAPPAPPPTPVATPDPSPPPPPLPSFNLQTARVELGLVRSNNASATSSSVSRALGPLAARFTACYRSALTQSAGASEGVATLHLESDEGGYVTTASVSGSAPATAARCIEGLCHNVHIEVDTGTANADVTLTFKPL